MGGTTEDEKEAEGYKDLTTSDSQNAITFTASQATGSANGSFEEVSDIIFTSQEQSILFRYFITNTNDGLGGDDPAVTFKVTGAEASLVKDNLNVTYQYKLADGGVETLSLTEGVEVTPGQELVIYVNIAVANADQNATLSGGVAWTLTAVDAAVSD